MRRGSSTDKSAVRQAAITAVCALIWGALSPTLLAQPEAMGADCGCLWGGSFSEVAPATDLIVIGEVRSIKGNAVDLVPEQVLKGAFWLDTLRVWMQTRDYCRPPATHFPAGSRWIMALSEIRKVPEDGFNPSTPNQSFGRPFDYKLSSCGGYWLSQAGERVSGNLVDAPRWEREPKMTPVLLDLVDAYLVTLPDGPRAARLADVARHLADTHFCWIGGMSEDAPFYS